MTRTELKRAARLIYRYRQMQSQVNQLEESLLFYLSAKQTAAIVVSDYKVSQKDGQLEIEELPKIDQRQLDLLADYFCLERR